MLLTLAVLAAIAYFILTFTYSEGSRSGILIKISNKGYVFKTYEGELNISGFGDDGQGSLLPNKIWAFSVKNKEVYQNLESFQGKKVVLFYDEVIYNFPWQGDTKYFIDSVALESSIAN
ncbi:MAG: 6-phosphogluconate dehydrogenase [Bacteroidetes bacterium]|nr:6-phosphogluconate dehydrogenase [Bacteroidota bacterium]